MSENTLFACGALERVYGTPKPTTSFTQVLYDEQATHRIKRVTLATSLGNHFVLLAHTIDGEIELYGVGDNDVGELCTTSPKYAEFTKLPTQMFTSRIKQVSCSFFDTTVLLEDNTMFSTGQVHGIGFKKVNVADNVKIAQIYSTTYNTIVLSETGEVYSFHPDQKDMRKMESIQDSVSVIVPGGYHIAYKTAEKWIVQTFDNSNEPLFSKEFLVPKNETIKHIACGWASVYAVTENGNIFMKMYNIKDKAPPKLVWTHTNIKKIVAFVDYVIVLTCDGKLWANGKGGEPKVHFDASSPSSSFYELDVSSQREESKTGTYIEDLVSASEGLFMLLGPGPRIQLDLLKIWRKEAFVDVIIKI